MLKNEHKNMKEKLHLDFIKLNQQYFLIKNKKGQIFFIDKILCFKDLKTIGINLNNLKDCQIFENFFDAKDKNENFEHAVYLDYNCSNATYLLYTYKNILHPIPQGHLIELMAYLNFKDIPSFFENYKI